MQTLIMLCLKDKDSIWEEGVTEQKAWEQSCWHASLSSFRSTPLFQRRRMTNRGKTSVTEGLVGVELRAPAERTPGWNLEQKVNGPMWVMTSRPLYGVTVNRVKHHNPEGPSTPCFLLSFTKARAGPYFQWNPQNQNNVTPAAWGASAKSALLLFTWPYHSYSTDNDCGFYLDRLRSSPPIHSDLLLLVIYYFALDSVISI